MLSITSAMRDTPEFSEILEKISAGGHPIVISGLLSVHKYHIAATLRRLTGRPVLCVFADDYDAQRAIPDLEALSGESSVSLAARDFTFYSVERASHDWERLRLSALHTMACGRSGLIVTSIAALTQRTLPPEALLSNTVSLKIGGEHDFKELCLQLVYLGYKRTETVETQGQFAVRGGILDFFSPGAVHPIRAEFFGDEIDSMGEFDPETQRRIANVQCATLLPALEALPPRGFDVSAALGGLLTDDISPELRKNIAADIESLRDGSSLPWFDRYLQLFYPEFTCGLDFLPKDAIILLDDYYKIRETALRAADQHADDIKTLIASGVLSPDFCDFFMSFDAAEARFRSFSLAFLEAFTRSSYNVPLGAIISVIAKQLPSYGGNLEVACADISHYVSEGFRMIVLAGTRERAHTMREALLRHGVTAALDFGLETLPAPGHVSIGGGSLSAGFEYPNMKLALIAEGQLIAPSRRGKRASRKGRQKIASYMDLSVGCLVVHDLHGIGRFAGVTKITVDRVEKDYIKIIYAGTDALYVPVTQLDMVSKYIGAGEDTHIRLSRLGGADWQKVKSRASGAAKDLAEYLVALYAKRRQTDGFAFPADCEWQRAFEDSFEFEETDDQLRCISEIKTDMERNFPMDRLLCGDVGFGKTEVALRAVMKCVLGGKQAAILVPTTVLAQQHFITAKRRFAKYPVRISVLSRFFSPTQNRETLRELRSGALDLVIGTHKLLQKSVVFKNLGLLIVDEEQRFGVSHKERLKEISANIDVLTLTATPIPRTLNMALSGIRDMSVIEEAPTGRHPVQTYVLEHDWNVIADAIRREVVRGGQVYYLHNRVASMDATVSRIMRLVPGITIGIAHGQMDENELSDVMQRMIAGELQVLVCSTIIETGIDISNVNTLIIEDADNLGLAQLHQIRGRVGRSPRHAF
ncbi:MAG: CarD family transcriptional regulator, partial [Clostridia bacterium]